MKKLFSLLLALAMIFGVMVALASCNKKPTPTPPGPSGGGDYAWSAADNKELNMRLSLHEQGFTNLSKRYITGQDTGGQSATVDTLVRERNQAAQDETMLKVNYLYWEGKEASWGDTDDHIIKDKNAFDETTPDIYITAVYDCIWATFSDGLANLVSTKRDNGNNYFSFLKEGYDSSKDDLGYNYDIMRSFSPVPDQVMFMLSSDYTIDTFRAIHAMPVSITVLEGIAADVAVGKYSALEGIDKNGDGTFAMSEFAQFVMDGNWTWDVLAAFCQAVYEPGTDVGETFGAKKFGFYMDVWGGSSARSIPMGSPFQHYTKTEVDGVPTYTQNGNTEFMTLANALTNLWRVDGAARVHNGNTADSAYDGALSVKGYTTLDTNIWSSLADAAIMEKFGKNEILFMNNGVIGSIEFAFLQNMKGGFGIVPMPVITATPGNPQYTTAIGNAARCAAINASTDDFMEATAYLDYQSTNSGDILRAYFRSQAYDSTNGEDYNVEMLEYIRSIFVDQSAQILDIYCQQYLSTANATNFPQSEKDKYFTGSAEQYDFSNNGTYAGIVEAFKKEDPATFMAEHYNEEYMNTINVMYKVIVDKFLAVAESSI